MQHRFRQHIDGKLRKWATAHPSALVLTEDRRKRRDEELSIILLDLRASFPISFSPCSSRLPFLSSEQESFEKASLRFDGLMSLLAKVLFSFLPLYGVTTDRSLSIVYEASALLSLFASNNPQLSSSIPHLVQALHPALSTLPSSSFRPDRPEIALESSLSALSLSSTPPHPATRAFFVSLHLLHSHLLPAFTSPAGPATPSSAFSASPSLSSFLPALHSLLAASSLPPPSWRNRTRYHSNPHIAFLLSLYTALVRNSYTSLARLLSSLPPPPSSVSSHLVALHLPPSSFNLLASLLRTSVPALRTHRFWPGVQKAYKFPPDRTAWLAKGLLFEFEVQVEGFVVAKEGKGKKEVESWEEDVVEDEQEERRKEAERRAEEWVKAKKAGA
jgi:hypothetical protein